MSTLNRIQSWYQRQCNGIWEHSLGVLIESTDNPGWWVKINIAGTKLEAVPFEEIRENVDDKLFPTGDRWLSCRAEGGTWHGAGDESKLPRILEAFVVWAEKNEN